MPGGGKAAKCIERILPNSLSTGAFILAVGEIDDINGPIIGPR
jgi:hypothetical protein